MFSYLSNRIIQYAVKRDYIKEDEIAIRLYGLELFFTILLNDITVVFIGAVMHMTIEAIVFWLIYKALKKYTGGFHFDSSIICYLSTVLLSIILLFLVKYCRFNSFIYSVIMLMDIGVLIILSPVPAVQKPLDEEEIKVFGIVARILVIIASVAYFVLFMCGLSYAAKVVALSVTAISMFAIAGKIKLTYHKRKTKNGNISSN